MQILFRDSDNQTRWAVTDGLRALGQQEVAVHVPWPQQDPRNRLIIDLLRFIERYIESQPKRILPDQTFLYGWTTLRFVSNQGELPGADADILLIEEIQQPVLHGEAHYVPGVAQMATLMQLQHTAMQRNRVSGQANHPHYSHSLVICKRISAATLHQLPSLMAHRAWQPERRMSGWFVGCNDHGHHHDDPEVLANIHLLHLIQIFPALFPYLAMPVGTQLLFEKSQVVVFHPGEEHGQLDAAPLLDALPEGSTL